MANAARIRCEGTGARYGDAGSAAFRDVDFGGPFVFSERKCNQRSDAWIGSGAIDNSYAGLCGKWREDGAGRDQRLKAAFRVPVPRETI